MTIKDYYTKLSNTSFHISLYFLALGIIWTVISIYILNNNILLTSLIFMCISTIYFTFYKYFDRKSTKVSLVNQENKDLCSIKQLLIEKDKDWYYFFSPDGKVLFTIIKDKQRYYICDDQNVEVALMEKTRGGSLYFHYKNEIYSGSIHTRMIKICEGIIKFSRPTQFECTFYKRGHQIAESKRGLLPLNWTSIFRLNIPVLTFHEKLTPVERVCIMLLSVIHMK